MLGKKPTEKGKNLNWLPAKLKNFKMFFKRKWKTQILKVLSLQKESGKIQKIKMETLNCSLRNNRGIHLKIFKV